MFSRANNSKFGAFPDANTIANSCAEQLRGLIHRDQLHSLEQQNVANEIIDISNNIVALYQGGLTLDSRPKVTALVLALDAKALELAKRWLDPYKWTDHERSRCREELTVQSRRLSDVLVREKKTGMPPSELQQHASRASDELARIAFSSPAIFDEKTTLELQCIAMNLHDIGEMVLFLDGGISQAKIRAGISTAAATLAPLVQKLSKA